MRGPRRPRARGARPKSFPRSPTASRLVQITSERELRVRLTRWPAGRGSSPHAGWARRKGTSPTAPGGLYLPPGTSQLLREGQAGGQHVGSPPCAGPPQSRRGGLDLSSGEAVTHQPAPAPAPLGLRHRGARTGCTARQAHGPRRGTAQDQDCGRPPQAQTPRSGTQNIGSSLPGNRRRGVGPHRAPPAPPRPGLTPALGQEHARPLEGVSSRPTSETGGPQGPGAPPGTPERAANRRPAGHREASTASSRRPARGHAAPSAPRLLWPGLRASIRSYHWP